MARMDLARELQFASEADLLVLWGMGFLAMAALALVADHLRSRREPLKRMQKVGWMPWTSIFMACLIIGGGLIALALPKALAS